MLSWTLQDLRVETKEGGDALALQGSLNYLILSLEFYSGVAFNYKVAEDKAEGVTSWCKKGTNWDSLGGD